MPDQSPPLQAREPAKPLAIEDYAVIGDCMTTALVGNNGSIDWLCWPRFDSGACFAALLGDSDNGRWLLAPSAPATRVSRSYHDDGLVLETLFETASGSIALIDFMIIGAANSTIVRIVEGRGGSVAMEMDLCVRFDYGVAVPWATRLPDGDGVSMIAGPDMAVLRTPLKLEGRDMRTVAGFTVAAGETVPFVLCHSASHLPPPPPIDIGQALAHTKTHWQEWSSRCTYDGPHQAAVKRSLVVLKSLTFQPTGGIVAAATTSLPEEIGGQRNWDYRYCWLRDATLTLFSLMNAGYYDEATAWRDWLHRSIAGSPSQIQIMYGIAGERRLAEWEAPWLPGYENSAPVRIGNAASEQLQLDIYGEVIEALHQARDGGLGGAPVGWALQKNIIAHLETIWQEPDEGIWETRGGRKQFTYSKTMVWLAFHRMVQDAEQYGLDGPVDSWRATRDQIHADVCAKGFNAEKNCFVQAYGSDQLDASLLLLPLVGFLPFDDPRILATTVAIERELLKDGFVLRYTTDDSKDGLPAGEGAFLACSFWLVDNWHMQGRVKEAAELFKRLLALRNDVGLLSEEYNPAQKRMTGNFPQAFSHTALISSAMNLAKQGAAQMREAD